MALCECSPAGTWPAGKCPKCLHRALVAERDALRASIREAALMANVLTADGADATPVRMVSSLSAMWQRACEERDALRARAEKAEREVEAERQHATESAEAAGRSLLRAESAERRAEEIAAGHAGCVSARLAAEAALEEYRQAAQFVVDMMDPMKPKESAGLLRAVAQGAKSANADLRAALAAAREDAERLAVLLPMVRANLKALAPYAPAHRTEECHGDKCREVWCESCFGDFAAHHTMAGAEEAVGMIDAALAAHDALAGEGRRKP